MNVYDNPTQYNWAQRLVINIGRDLMLDTTIYENPNYAAWHMERIKWALEDNIDPTPLLHYNLSKSEVIKISNGMRNNNGSN